MASTGTQTAKTQQTQTDKNDNPQAGTPSGGSSATAPAQTPSSQSQSPQPQTGQSSGANLARTSDQGQRLARSSGYSPMYFPSSAEFFSNPFGVMRRIQEEMDRAFASAWPGSGSSGPQGAWTPAIDVSEREGNLVVHAELPGVRPEDVQLEVDNDALVLSGHRERSEEHNDQGYRRRERSFGSFYRAIPLPEGADVDKAKAQFNHGVLEITLPVPQRQSQSRRIPIGTQQTNQQQQTIQQKT
jgi:HSP20 family protein